MRRQLRRGKSGTILGGKSQKFGVPLKPGVKDPGRASMEVYWHPNRDGVEHAPEEFARKLREMHPDLACCRAPARAPLGMPPAYVLWYKRPRITHPLSPGWMMLFSWRNPHTQQPEVLDERVFAVLYASSALKWGTGKQYFERALVQKQREAKQSRERSFENHRKAKQKELLTTHRISNLGDGSRFANHHDGTVVASRGSLAWHESKRRRILPPEMIKAEDEAKEQGRALASDVEQAVRKLR